MPRSNNSQPLSNISPLMSFRVCKIFWWKKSECLSANYPAVKKTKKSNLLITKIKSFLELPTKYLKKAQKKYHHTKTFNSMAQKGDRLLKKISHSLWTINIIVWTQNMKIMNSRKINPPLCWDVKNWKELILQLEFRTLSKVNSWGEWVEQYDWNDNNLLNHSFFVFYFCQN